jgi:hypothetical protein
MNVNKKDSTGRRKRRTGNRNPFLIQINGRTSALGKQFTHLLVTQVIQGKLDTQSSIALASAIYTAEFRARETLWNYFKVQQICVTVYPNNLNTSVEPCYLYVNWGGATNPVNIRLMDNVKLVPAYRTRYYTYCYQVPDVEEDGFNFKKYHPVDNAVSYPGSICLYSPGNTDTWNVRLDIYIKFKGALTGIEPTRRDASEFYVKNDELEKDQPNIQININQDDVTSQTVANKIEPTSEGSDFGSNVSSNQVVAKNKLPESDSKKF